MCHHNDVVQLLQWRHFLETSRAGCWLLMILEMPGLAIAERQFRAVVQKTQLS